MFRDFEVDMTWRPARNVEQCHARLFGGAIALLDITLQTRCNDVVPGIGSTFGSRDDVVDGKVVASIAAILTSVVIAMQQIAPRQTNFFVWNFDVAAKSDYRR